MAQSLEELSSIYLEDSQEGLTALGTTQPFSVTVDQERRTSISTPLTTTSVIQDEFHVTEGSGVQHETNMVASEDQETLSPENLQMPAHKPPRKKRMTYDYIPADIKRRVVEYASRHGTRPAAQLFEINEPTIRYWKHKGFDITRGRKVTYGKELDDELYRGLMALKSGGVAINVDKFIEYAKKTIDDRRPELNFKCSRGWLEKFFKRHSLAITKSESGKVMDIVRRENDMTQMFGEDDFDELEEEEEEEGGNELHVPLEGFVLSHTLSESSNQLADNISEDAFSSAPKRMRMLSPDPHMVALGNNSPSASSIDPDILAQQKSKTLHMMSILKKLKSTRKSIDSYQKQEVINHAKQHGSRSAERVFGVPETTIRYWVKKNTLSDKQSPTPPSSSSFSLGSSVPLGLMGLSTGTPTTSLMMSPSDSCLAQPHSDGLLTDKAADDCNAPTCASSDAEAVAQILLWALTKKSHGECVGFDELCDQVLSFISLSNPKSAYSSTRKWVGELLELKVRDILNID